MVTTLGSLFLYCIYKQPKTHNFQSLYQSLPWSDSWGSFFHAHSQSLHKPLTSVADTACWLCRQQTIDFNCSHRLLACHQQIIEFSRSHRLLALPSANCWVQLQSPSVGFAISRSMSLVAVTLCWLCHLMTGFAISKPLSSVAVTVCWLAISKPLSSVAVAVCWLCHLMIGFAISKSLSSVAVTICQLCHQLSQWVQLQSFSVGFAIMSHHWLVVPLAKLLSSVAVSVCWLCHHITSITRLSLSSIAVSVCWLCHQQKQWWVQMQLVSVGLSIGPYQWVLLPIGFAVLSNQWLVQLQPESVGSCWCITAIWLQYLCC